MASTSSSTELVNEEPERQSLQKPFIKSTTKKSNYGSLRKEVQQTSTLFIVNYKHKLQEGETLQGISLKYSVPIESIKRANRLWSNDLTAFVKEFLIIPISKEKLKELNLDENNLEPTNITNKQSNLVVVNGDKNNNLTQSLAKNLNSKGQDSTLNDYLSKFDSFLSESKLKLKTLEANPNLRNKKSTESLRNSVSSTLNSTSNHFADDESDGDIFNKDKRNNLKKLSTIDATNSYSNVSSSSLSSNEQTKTITPSSSTGNFEYLKTNTPELLITSPNKYVNYYTSNHNLIATSSNSNVNVNSSRARLAQENLERLEREKDDFYEL